MNWTSGDAYFIRSGEYTIARITLKGGDLYELWRGRMHVGSYATADEARAAADAHAVTFAQGQPA